MIDILKNLQPTTWYKTLIVVSAAAFLIALASQRDALSMIFVGAFLVGLGEWKIHPKRQVEFRHTPAGLAKVTDVPRKANFFGVFLQIVGGIAIIYGAYRGLGLSLPDSWLRHTP